MYKYIQYLFFFLSKQISISNLKECSCLRLNYHCECGFKYESLDF